MGNKKLVFSIVVFMAAIMLIPAMSNQNAYATITSGSVTGGNSGGVFEQIFDPIGPVGNNNLQSPNLIAFDEAQNLVLTQPLTIDALPQPLNIGDTVSSHYIIFDPLPSSRVTGCVQFDSDIFGVIAATQNQLDSDILGNPTAQYLSPGARGLEAADSFVVNFPREVCIDFTASSPGDAIRVVTGFSPNAGAIRDNSGFYSNTLAPNDDGSTGCVSVGFDLNFFGTVFPCLFVNNNGNITFDSRLGTFTPFDLTSTGRQIVAPFFGDVDTRRAGSPVTYGEDVVNGRPAFAANWVDVDCFSSSASRGSDIRNSFQVVLTDRSDIAAQDFDIEFNYDQITWETGQASGSNSDCLGGQSARVGYSDGTGRPDTFFELPGSAVNGAFLDGGPANTALIHNSLNSNVDGRYIFTVRSGQASPGPQPQPGPQQSNGGDNQWDTRPSFGISHETRQDQIVENGFSFNTEQFTLTDNHWTDFAEQSVKIGTVNSFSATVWADKGLKVQEFLFGIPNVGEAHLAELGVEIWYDTDGEIEDVVVVQNSHVIDADTITVSHEMTKCLSTEEEAKCDTTTVSMKFLEPLQDKVMAIKAIDWKNRDQKTFLNDGFNISGESLNPMLTNMIPSAVKYEGLLKVTQVAKYSPYWVSDDDRMFEMNSFGSLKQINYKFERFQDGGNAFTRMHSGFGGIIAYEQNRALDIFDASNLASELPASFAYIFPETGERINEEMTQAMLLQEEIAQKVLDEMNRQQRDH